MNRKKRLSGYYSVASILAMKIKTWVDNLTDESNLWLNAIREEETGNLAEASTYYLKNAAECLKAGMLVRAALSSSCAAACLEKSGDRLYAEKLYREAASIYERHAKKVVGHSIREALWCLHQAYRCFVSGDDPIRAREIYDDVVSLEERIAPFSSQDGRDLTHTRAIRPRPEGAFARSQPVNEDIKKALEDFLTARSELGRTQTAKLTDKKQNENRDGEIHEASTFNQLG